MPLTHRPPPQPKTAPSPALSAVSALSEDTLDHGAWPGFDLGGMGGFEELTFFDLAGTDPFRTFLDPLKARTDKIKEKIAKSRKAITRKLRQPTTLKARDKIIFCIGVTNVWATALCLGLLPKLAPHVYVAKFIILMLWRFVTYRKRKWHYFLWDMCYFCNILLIFYILAPQLPYSGALFIAMWGLVNGPVLTAITAWGNSLVFHSLDKMTSLFIHMEPPLILYILRHHHYSFEDSPLFATADICLPDEISLAAFWQLFWNSVLFYLVWQVVYHVYITIYKADKIHSGGHVTSSTWLLSNNKSHMYKLCYWVSGGDEEHLQYSYVFVQLAYTLITTLPTILYYYVHWLHACVLIFSLMMATWNGANFYFEIFSSRYRRELESLANELREMEEQEHQLEAHNNPEEQPILRS